MARFGLDIPPGLVSDDTAFAAKGAWKDADKVRFWRDKAQLIGGWEGLGSTQLAGVCRTVLSWTDLSDDLIIAFGLHNGLQLLKDGQTYTITPTGFVPGFIDGTGGSGYGTGTYGTGYYGLPTTNGTQFPLTWSLSTYGQGLIANPRGQGIYWWRNDTSMPAAIITQAPAQVTYTLVTPSRQVLAFGCNQVAAPNTFNAMTIRGSDFADPTNWTPSSANNSFEYTLQGTGGRIVAARLIGAYLYVWTDDELFLGTLTGDTNNPYRFDRVDGHCGLAGPNAAVIMGQTAYWLATDLEFRTSGLGAEVSVAKCPIRDDFVQNLAPSQNDKVVLSTCAQFSEIRMDYPDIRDGAENSRYLVVNSDGHWSRGKMARSAYVDAGPAPDPIAVTPDGFGYYQERGDSANGAPISWSLTSADQYLADAEQCYRIDGVWPDFADQQGAVNLTIGARQFPQDTIRMKGPWALTAATRHRDFRVSARIMQIMLSGYSSPAAFRLGRLTFDAVQEGAR